MTIFLHLLILKKYAFVMKRWLDRLEFSIFQTKLNAIRDTFSKVVFDCSAPYMRLDRNNLNKTGKRRMKSSSSLVFFEWSSSSRTNSAFNPLHYVHMKLTDEQSRCVYCVALITNKWNEQNKKKRWWRFRCCCCFFSTSFKRIEKKT